MGMRGLLVMSLFLNATAFGFTMSTIAPRTTGVTTGVATSPGTVSPGHGTTTYGPTTWNPIPPASVPTGTLADFVPTAPIDTSPPVDPGDFDLVAKQEGEEELVAASELPYSSLDVALCESEDLVITDRVFKTQDPSYPNLPTGNGDGFEPTLKLTISSDNEMSFIADVTNEHGNTYQFKVNEPSSTRIMVLRNTATGNLTQIPAATKSLSGELTLYERNAQINDQGSGDAVVFHCVYGRLKN